MVDLSSRDFFEHEMRNRQINLGLMAWGPQVSLDIRPPTYAAYCPARLIATPRPASRMGLCTTSFTASDQFTCRLHVTGSRLRRVNS